MEYIEAMTTDCDDIEMQLYNIALYSEGGFTLTEASMMSFAQREKVVNMLNKRAEKMSGKEYM